MPDRKGDGGIMTSEKLTEKYDKLILTPKNKTDKNVEIYVSPEHKFGTDAFLLADFTQARQKDSVCDLGTGCGIIAVLIKIRNKSRLVYGVDIQEQAIEQLNITVEKNQLDGFIPVLGDLKELGNRVPKASFDVVTCNPPYKATNAGIESLGEAQRIARHEIMCNINDVCKTASGLLKFGGKLCLCNRPERLADVITAMKNNNIEPKKLRFVAKDHNSASWLFLIEGRLGGKPFMEVMPTLTMRSGDGITPEVAEIYGGIV